MRQIKAVKALAGNGGKSIGKAMREAGYSKISANTPKKLTESKAWNDLLDEFLPDEYLAKRTKWLTAHKSYQAVNAGLTHAFRLKNKNPKGSEPPTPSGALSVQNITQIIINPPQHEKPIIHTSHSKTVPSVASTK